MGKIIKVNFNNKKPLTNPVAGNLLPARSSITDYGYILMRDTVTNRLVYVEELALRSNLDRLTVLGYIDDSSDLFEYTVHKGDLIEED